MRAPYNLSVSFRGWKNISTEALRSELDARYGLPQHNSARITRSGECALLEIANNDTRELSFNALAVEYKTTGGWRNVVPSNWPWFSSSAWYPGTASTIPVPRPAEVPRDAIWKIQFVCYPKGEVDESCKTRMETAEIPPIKETDV